MKKPSIAIIVIEDLPSSQIWRWLKEFFGCKTGPATSLNLHPSVPFKEETMADIALTMNDNQNDVITAAPKDAKGNPVADALVWTVDDATVCSIAPSADGLSCTVSAIKPGSCKVTASDGQTPPLTQTVDITVQATAPASLNLSTGTPTNQ